ncbi:hypothetical protein EYZ11_010045 [Aspergillus tanneri]|uniref:Uncharacterized protein n=1 Tax=Aspergillus tanneri TaxID=1220188 RepID=A0A4S3J6D8_9EURO|nr:uncharacterized protein ATNIH1004_005558 [Aspergillus tanneri]KAA8646883.1 hypothetical protein ATNIH1004_005558 [Aspergillus tanneri]THC90499.1 hypothetical protein EYZ11_010045 [Aspergillus tanneri]
MRNKSSPPAAAPSHTHPYNVLRPNMSRPVKTDSSPCRHDIEKTFSSAMNSLAHPQRKFAASEMKGIVPILIV